MEIRDWKWLVKIGHMVPVQRIHTNELIKPYSNPVRKGDLRTEFGGKNRQIIRKTVFRQIMMVAQFLDAKYIALPQGFQHHPVRKTFAQEIRIKLP